MNHQQRDLIERLDAAGVELKIEGDRLRYRCPKGALTPELRTELEAWKPDLLFEYRERMGILIFDARLPQAEAEALAARLVIPNPANPVLPADLNPAIRAANDAAITFWDNGGHTQERGPE